jgi:hypothetical protein
MARIYELHFFTLDCKVPRELEPEWLRWPSRLARVVKRQTRGLIGSFDAKHGIHDGSHAAKGKNAIGIKRSAREIEAKDQSRGIEA